MKFSIKDFFSKSDQIRSFLRIWLHLLKKFLMENFIFCAVIFLFMNILMDDLLMRFFYIQNRKMCLSKPSFYQYLFGFLPCLALLLLWKHFICDRIALKTQYKPPLTL